MGEDFRIASIVGARPNFIKLAPVHKILNRISEHTIIHTGQHYDFEMSEIFFRDLKLPKPDYNLQIGSGSQGYQVGEMIKEIEKVLIINKYDLVIVYGDTNTTFAGAFSAMKANLTVAHIEAGLRSFDRQMPEEINRILTDNISNLLFAPTRTAVENLLRENVSGKIIETGDLSVEIINEVLNASSKSKILDTLDIEPQSYVLFTMHRAENTYSKETMMSVIKSLEDLKDIHVVFPIHPRTRKVLQENNLYKRIEVLRNVKVVPPVGYVDFIKLMHSSNKILTDSGGIQKEAYLLSVPCITLRNNTEWIETVNEGWNVLVNTDKEKIVQLVKDWYPNLPDQKPIFGDGNTSMRIKDTIVETIKKTEKDRLS